MQTKLCQHLGRKDSVSLSPLSMQKFTSFTFLSAKSVPETPDYVHSPPPQQEVNVKTERTEELVFSLAEMP